MYKNKYLKYKQKYIKLKKYQNGGLIKGEITRFYKNNINLFIENREQNLALLLQSYNIPYSERLDKVYGLWYSSDYSQLINNNDEYYQFIGLTNFKYWDITVLTRINDSTYSYFQSFDYINPSDALKAFIIGPTFTECANIIQVTIYHHILNIVGEEKFNYLFGNILTPFIITPILYEPWKIKIRKLGTGFNSDLYEPILENPLYFLYDRIDDYSLNSLENNDIVYIEGVREYKYKHFSGNLIGFNLICYRPSKYDKPKFIGFGPNEFNTGPKTYEEIHQLLINGYNQDQDENTNKIITEKLKNTDPLLQESAKFAQLLKYDIVPQNFPIIGITHRLRFSQEKLINFIETPKQEWYKESISKLIKLLPKPVPKAKKINILLKSFSYETQKAHFFNYERKTKQQDDMWNYMMKFSIKVVTKNVHDGPIGIILSGSPGIGKTHLSVAVAKYVANHGKIVTFVDEEYINSKITSNGVPDFTSLISTSDLIILDDINSQFGGGAEFLKVVLKYVITNNKALLYTSNNVIPIIQSNLPIFFGYDHPYAKNFVSINNIIADSFRKPWININLNIITNEEKYKLLNSYIGGQSAGIIIETNDIDEQKYINQFNIITNNTQPIRIVRDWFDEQSLLAFKKYDKVNELQSYHRQQYKGDVTDLEQYKFIIIRIHNKSTTNQLLKILPRMHDNGIKVIVLVSSYDYFKQLINLELNSYDLEKYKIRLIDRLNIIFPNIIT